MSAAAQRFWKHVDKTENCWNWTGSRMGAGYGEFRCGFRDGKRLRWGAHRWAYEALRGPIPEGLQLDHLCRNRLCVNPDHLEPVTHAENHARRRGFKTGPYDVGTHCRHGHERTPENTRTNANGARVCVPCARLAAKRHRERRLSNTVQ